MEFKQKNTGAILKTENEFVINQLKKSNDYEEIKHFTKQEKELVVDNEEKVEEKTEKKKND